MNGVYYCIVFPSLSQEIYNPARNGNKLAYSYPELFSLNQESIHELEHFINELEKIGLQLIHITGTYMGRLNVLLEAKDASIGGQANTLLVTSSYLLPYYLPLRLLV
jgi:hypothetical protein